MSKSEQRSILVVEDDQDILFAVSTFLELEGYRILAATQGEEALKLLEVNPMPNLILLDMIMPVMNGWQFAAAFHKRYGEAAAPILVMTAAANAEQRASDVQAASWISKPFQIEELLTQIQRLQT